MAVFKQSNMLTKNFIATIAAVVISISAFSQMAFDESPKRYFKAVSPFAKVEDSLKAEFREKGLDWPAKYMYVRAFKAERQLEVWVKGDYAEAFQLFKVYKVCATSGTFGPKRKEGDKQIPEGFYYINEFNPNSNYHLALGLNYPNASDAILSDHQKPGGDIYIHGNCVTIGCLPITDSLIEQVYLMASVVKDQGQDFIPVHIYPLRYDNPKSQEQFHTRTKAKADVQHFAQSIRDAYEYFEDTHQLPAIMVDSKGSYVVAGNPDAPKVARVKFMETGEKDPYAGWSVEEKVDKVPFYKDGNAALQKWLFQLSQELSATLPANTSVSIQVEFIVDKEGNTKMVHFIRGGSTTMNATIKERFEKELKWTPALKNGEPVNTKLKQNLNLSAPEDL
jgi:murein L,D-transpeptidase YafK